MSAYILACSYPPRSPICDPGKPELETLLQDYSTLLPADIASMKKLRHRVQEATTPWVRQDGEGPSGN